MTSEVHDPTSADIENLCFEASFPEKYIFLNELLRGNVTVLLYTHTHTVSQIDTYAPWIVIS